METDFIKQQYEKHKTEYPMLNEFITLDEEDYYSLTAQIIKNTCEEIKRQYFSHTNTDKKLIEVVEDIINNITYVLLEQQ